MQQVNPLPQIIEVATFKINTSKQLLINSEVLKKSPNSEFFALEMYERIYLIKKYGKVLLHIVAVCYNFQFSQDNKYFAILLQKTSQLTIFLLYSFESFSVQLIKKFQESLENEKNQIIFLQDQMILSLCGGVKSVSYNGVISEIKIPQRMHEYEMFELDNRLLLFCNYFKERPYYILICRKRFIRVKNLGQQKSTLYGFGQLLNRFLIIHTGTCKLSEVVHGKILRRFQHIRIIRGQGSSMMQGSLINNELYVFQQDHYNKQNFVTGVNHIIPLQIPIPLMRIPTLRAFRDPLFLIQILKKKGKKEKKMKIILKLLKMII